jgi:hypothetical protein
MPKISKAVCRELELAVCDGPVVRLREPVSDGAHAVLLRSGASWSSRWDGYFFADLYPYGQASEVVERIVARRAAVNPPDRGVVSCPQSIAELLWASLPWSRKGLLALEPSAGHGVLAAEGAARGHQVDCYEVDKHRAAEIRRARIARRVTVADFLTITPRPKYDVVAMYPPYRRNVAAAHVLHAYGFLRPGGVLGALVPAGIEWGASPAARQLRTLLHSTGYVQLLDDLDDEDGYLLTPRGARPRAQIMYLDADK